MRSAFACLIFEQGRAPRLELEIYQTRKSEARERGNSCGLGLGPGGGGGCRGRRGKALRADPQAPALAATRSGSFPRS
eukprot:3596359-Rhodomonas_salina.1